MRISIGHLVQATVLCVGIGATYAGLAGKQDALRFDLESQKTALAAYQRADVATAREAIMLEALTDLKQRLERIEKKIDSR